MTSLQKFIFYSWILLALCSGTGLVFAADAYEVKPIYFLSLADIHFDPFLYCAQKIPCPFIAKLQQTSVNEWEALFTAKRRQAIRYGEDSNVDLLQSALIAAQHEAEKYQAQFILILGDFLGHDFKRQYRLYSGDESQKAYPAFVNKVLIFLTNEIAKTFPTIDVYPVLGNNDTYQSDYHSTPEGAFFQAMGSEWSTLIKTKNNRADMKRGFSKAGYYAVTLSKQPHLRLIVLNTTLFSYNAKGKDITRAADEELNWLHHQLKLAKENHQKIFIAMHIPESIDLYVTRRVRLFRLLVLWKPQYMERFEKELTQFSSEIISLFTGHLHLDWFQILTFADNENEIIMTGVPSISPIFGNNPGFKMYRYLPQTFRLENTATYYYPINESHTWSSASNTKPFVKAQNKVALR